MAEGNQSTRITKFGPAADLQYVLDKKLHSSPQLHKIGEALLDPTYVSPTVLSNGAAAVGAVGSSDEVARADHVHGLEFGMHAFGSFASTEPFTFTTTYAVITGTLTGSIVVPRNSFGLFNMTVDAEGVVTGFGLIAVALEMSINGGAFAAFPQVVVFATPSGFRLTVAQSVAAFLAPATYQFRMMGNKSAAGGTVVCHATHTNLQGLILG